MYEEEEATNQLRRRLRCPRFCPRLSCEPGEKIYRPRPRGRAGCMCPACMSGNFMLKKISHFDANLSRQASFKALTATFLALFGREEKLEDNYSYLHYTEL